MSITHSKSVTVVGLGYIGLPTAAFFAKSGYKVHGFDLDNVKVRTIQRGEVPFVEPGFNELLSLVVRNGMLVANSKLVPSENYIIAVPTPIDSNRKVDETYVEEATKEISEVLSGGELIVLESTSPPGMTKKIAELVIAERPDLTLEPALGNSIYVAHAPERVLPGRIMEEMVLNSRIVGGINDESSIKARELYQSFVEGEVFVTDSTTAEMCKLTENSFRDVNIAFANELEKICSKHSVDVWELIALANKHPRVNVLNPGPGVGGHCIAVDPWFLVSSAPESSRLIRTAREVNDQKPQEVLAEITNAIKLQSSEGIKPRIALLGIAFKPDIDDLRESPSLQIATQLVDDFPEIRVMVVEPHVDKLPDVLVRPNVTLMKLSQAIEEATVVVLLVDHKEFLNDRSLILSCKYLIDTRGIASKFG